MTDKKTTKGNYHVRIYLKDVLGFAQHQEKATYVLESKLTLQRNRDIHVLSHLAGVNDAASFALAGKDIRDDKSWYVPHYTLNTSDR